jgi:alkylation response protein AidB-like acyl-CoA dehydrogenase
MPTTTTAVSHLVDVTAALAGLAESHDRTADLPSDGLAVVHHAGLLTLTVGTGYGGPGGSLADTVRTLTALGQGDPSVALISAMTLFAHAAQARTHAWPAGTYAEVLAESAVRPTLINALRVEPDLGTPARGGVPATTARRTPDGWEITGHKIFSTGATGLRWMQVWARIDDGSVRAGSDETRGDKDRQRAHEDWARARVAPASAGAKPVPAGRDPVPAGANPVPAGADPVPAGANPARAGAFLVRADTPGITIQRTWDHLGLRASRSDDVILDRVRVPENALLRETSDSGDLRAWNALGIAAIYLGVAYAARDWLTGYLQERVPSNLGKPLASLPRFQSEVGAIQASLSSAQAFLTTVADQASAAENALNPGNAATAGNRTAGNGTAGNRTAGKRTAGNGTAGNETAGNGTAGKRTAGDVAAGNRTASAEAAAVARGEAAAQAGLAKTVVTNAAIDAVQRAVALIGNAGLSRHNPLERHLRDVLCGRIHTPQDDVVLVSAGISALAAAAGSSAWKGNH